MFCRNGLTEDHSLVGEVGLNQFCSGKYCEMCCSDYEHELLCEKGFSTRESQMKTLNITIKFNGNI